MFYVMHLLLPFPAFMYLHRVSQLGTLDEPRVRWDIGAEPEEGARWAYPESGRIGQVLGREMLTCECHLTKLTCVGSQASHGAL